MVDSGGMSGGEAAAVGKCYVYHQPRQTGWSGWWGGKCNAVYVTAGWQCCLRDGGRKSCACDVYLILFGKSYSTS